MSKSIPFDDPRFTAAVDHVLSSYESHGGINHLEGANLPSRERMIELFYDVEEVLFPGYYEKEPLSSLNLRYVIGQRLARIYEGLVVEVTKANRHGLTPGDGTQLGADESLSRAREVAIELLEALPEIRGVLREDAMAAYDGDPAASSFVQVVLSYPYMRAISAYRVAHFLHQREVPMIPRMLTEHLHSKTGIDIHPGATIGPGVFIDHGTGVVIGETTVIGCQVKIYQGVTLGALSVDRSPEGKWKGGRRHPTIEDGVTLYAGATILGGETVIGEGSVIGGNTWLTRSVASGTRVMIEPPYQVYQSGADGSIQREELQE